MKEYEKAIDEFAEKMKAKMRDKEKRGYKGWDDPNEFSARGISKMLIKHVAKGDPVDVANFCMMLDVRDSGIVLRDVTSDSLLRCLT